MAAVVWRRDTAGHDGRVYDCVLKARGCSSAALGTRAGRGLSNLRSHRGAEIAQACAQGAATFAALPLTVHSSYTRTQVNPNAHTFTTIINACTQANDLDRGLLVLEQMMACGVVQVLPSPPLPFPQSVPPGASAPAPGCFCPSLSVLTCAPLSPSLSSDAQDVGHASVTPYTTLIRACGKVLAVDKAFKVLRCMLDAGVKPNVVTFNCLIDACGRAQQLDKAFHVLQLMHHYDSPPDMITFSCAAAAAPPSLRVMISACDAASRAPQIRGPARTLLRIHNTRTHSICTRTLASPVYSRHARTRAHTPHAPYASPTIAYVHRALIDACCKALETDKAFQLLMQMRQQLNQEPNSSTYAALLESCARAGRVDQAFEALSLMGNAGVRPAAPSCSLLIEACGRAGMAEQVRPCRAVAVCAARACVCVPAAHSPPRSLAVLNLLARTHVTSRAPHTRCGC